jgi:hypothetical protein
VNERYPEIRLYKLVEGERHLHIRESVGITFYMRNSHHEVAQAVEQALEVYRHAVGPQALQWYVDDEGDWYELDDKGWEFNRRKLLHRAGGRLWLRELPGATTGHEFIYHGRQLNPALDATAPGAVCAVSFWFPTEYLEARGPGQVKELALELARRLPFNSGHAGLALLFPEGALGTTRTLRDLFFRYPGLDIPGLASISQSIGTRVRGASWLTFLGRPLLGKLGGAAGLRARLSSGITVQELDGERAIVALGEWPEAGDVVEGRTLPAYEELSRVLRPWLYEQPSPWSGFTKEDMRHWEQRFLAQRQNPPTSS